MRIKKTEERRQKTEGKIAGQKRLLSLFFLCVLSVLCGKNVTPAWAGEEQVRKAMKKSIVYLEISSYGYDQIRPWRNTEIQQKSGVGCAVGKYEAITPAWNLTNAKLIKARVFGQNEYIPAKIKTVDYEIDLALIEFEPNDLQKPLNPLKFADKFKRGAKLNYYWLDSAGNLTTGQGYLDRAEVRGSPVSYNSFLTFVVTNTSQETGTGQLYCIETTPIGIGCWSDGTRETGLIPAAVINNFVSKARESNYPGVATSGFEAGELLDPATRAYLKMPETLKTGVQVTNVYTLGTGSGILSPNDVILKIDGEEIDGHGKFSHPVYDRVSFQHLITSHKVGDEIDFEIWRDGARQKIKVKAQNFNVEQMLVPFYEYGKQPEYVVTGGFVFQKLTLPYMANFGKDWDGKVSPHLFHYFRDTAFKPTDERKNIVILSYVLPSPINLGYIDLAQQVVSKINDMPITSMADIIKAQNSKPESKFDVVEFELDNPTVVIPRSPLPQADALIGRNYGIRKMVNIISDTD
ncbi:MAG: PDZ domain-containing protein [Sedimentisphaerales bacterium]|nr:PDZ domain-containing protein [Sedimentisphaerales bacterium]